VQIPGLAQRISVGVIKHELLGDERLHAMFCRFEQILLARSMQMSLCNMFRPVEQRCIRWLLTVSELTGDNEIPLTHELIATMLGVHRPTVTLVVRSLARAGFIDEARGRILLRDPGRLEAASCECYRAMRAEARRLFGY
jgi:CRP-like cAMP-binding protein